MTNGLDAVSHITFRGRRLRDAVLVMLFVMLCVALAFQIKNNNGVAGRQHDSCVSRREFAFESRRRQYVLERFLGTAADTRLKLSHHDADATSRAINFHVARYWKYRLLPLIHTVPIPPAC